MENVKLNGYSYENYKLAHFPMAHFLFQIAFRGSESFAEKLLDLYLTFINK